MSVTHHKMVINATNIAPGQTHGWRWNNAVNGGVYQISVVTHAFPSTPYSGKVQIEVSPLRYGRKLSNNSRYVEYTLKNLSSHYVTYQVYLSMVH